MKKLFRIENPNTQSGMWYTLDGVYNPFIKTLTEGKSADLPMEFHERYRKDGRAWFSSCDSIEQLRGWFTSLDIKELYAAGYILYEYLVEEFIEEEFQVIFTKEGVISQSELDKTLVEELFGITLP